MTPQTLANLCLLLENYVCAFVCAKVNSVLSPLPQKADPIADAEAISQHKQTIRRLEKGAEIKAEAHRGRIRKTLGQIYGQED
jgi:hypothetical protein